MLVVFEVHIAPGADPDALISPDTARESNAQIMTPAEARKVGFAGLPDFGDKEVRLVAVAKRDAPWIQRILETSDVAGSYKVHDVG